MSIVLAYCKVHTDGTVCMIYQSAPRIALDNGAGCYDSRAEPISGWLSMTRVDLDPYCILIVCGADSKYDTLR